MYKLRLFQILAVVVLLLGTAPAWAQTVQFQDVSYTGTYQGLVPGGVVVQTPLGQALLPQGLSFTIAGQRIDLSSLLAGTNIRVNLPGTAGQIVGGYGNMVFVQYPSGVVPVPWNAIGDSGGQAKVRVLKKNGKTVLVPLNAALNMQRAQGACILGNSPLGTWQSGWTGPAVVYGHQGDYLLMQTMVKGVPRLVRVPRSQVGTLAKATPGRVVNVTRQGTALGWGTWHATTRGPAKTVAPGHSKTVAPGHSNTVAPGHSKTVAPGADKSKGSGADKSQGSGKAKNVDSAHQAPGSSEGHGQSDSHGNQGKGNSK